MNQADSPFPSPAAVRQQLRRLQQSVAFAGSERLVAFLDFVVEETLAGRGALLKESVIGNAIYGREPPYDPRIDSTVRVEARRLRGKLKAHYAGQGQTDPVVIDLPTGRYTPRFSVRTESPSQHDPMGEKGVIFEKGRGAAVAVMPFHALSADPADETFADGLTDELIFTLGRVHGLRITSRSMAFHYKNRPSSLTELARDLGVDAVLQGTVRREGDILRVTVEVSNPQGFVMWSDRFDAPGHERMRLQEQIALTLSSRVRLDSSQIRAQRAGPGPEALDAHARIYRARQLLDQQTPASLREALEIFTEVSLSTSDYARGYSGIADCQCDLFRLGLTGRAEAASIAKQAIRRALEIDPLSVEARTAQATVSAWLEWDRDAAQRHFQDAMAMGGTARTARLFGVHLTYVERHDEAARLFRDARAMEPFSVQQDIAEAISHYQARRFRLLTAVPPRAAPPEVLVHVALAHLFGGTPEDARRLLPDLPQTLGEFPHLALAHAEILAWLGDEPPPASLPDASWFARATLAAARGDETGCLDALEAAIATQELPAVWMRTDPRFDRLRPMPRFNTLLDRMAPSA